MLKKSLMLSARENNMAVQKVQECNQDDTNNIKEKMPHFECVELLNQLPVVESAVGVVGNFYHKLKRSNSLCQWTLAAAEAGVSRMALTIGPPLAKPLHVADSALCISLAFVEDNVPAVKLPPDQLLVSARAMMRSSAEHLARPMLRRASSVRELAAHRVSVAKDYGMMRANEIMNTRVGSLATDGLEVGLGMAEHLMDTFLPDDSAEDGTPKNEGEDVVDQAGQEKNYSQLHENDGDAKDNRALHTVHRVDRLTRTLQRRLTRRTLAQVKSLREHGMDAVRYLLGLAHVAVTDPRGSATRVAELWAELSRDEPENQPPPESVEQRTALLAREAARRVVHAVNAVAALPGRAGDTLSQLLVELLHGLRLDGPTRAVMTHTRMRLEQLQNLIMELNSLTNQILDMMFTTMQRNGSIPNNNHHTNNHQTVPNHVNCMG